MPQVVVPEAGREAVHLAAGRADGTLQPPGLKLAARTGEQRLARVLPDVRGQLERERLWDGDGCPADLGLEFLGRVLHGRVDDPAHEVDIGHAEPAA